MNFLKELILVSLNEPDSNLQWLAEFYGKKGLKFFTRSRGEPPPSFYIEKIGQFASLLGRGSGQVCDAAIYIIIYFELELGDARLICKLLTVMTNYKIYECLIINNHN